MLSSRAAAARRAQAAKAQRDHERRERETRIEAALTDYYQAVAAADRIRSAAARKAEQLAADADRAAAEPDSAARDAVRRLKDLLGGSAEVARLCGISTATVRELLAAAGSSENTGGDDGA
jgi:hypothetical protein